MLSRRGFLVRTGTLGAGLIGLTTRANPGADTPGPAAAYTNHLTPDALRATERGLAFLANTQNPDGSFGDSPMFRGNLAITALGGLALMAGGHTPGRGQYGANVLRALQYVLSKEQREPAGFLNNPVGDARQGPMYSHGFATLFLAEAFGMVPDRALQDRLRGTIERAVRLIVTCQNSEGGWRYEPMKVTADSSVTICQIMALRSARNVGFFVPKEAADKCANYVLGCQTGDGGFSYFKGQPGSAFPRSAAGIVALYCAGKYSGKEIDSGLRYLMKFKPGAFVGGRAAFFEAQHYYYGQYYAAQAMWTAGPKYWDEWFPAIRDELLRLNRGRGDGSWSDPTICSHYATAMACIILQIPNNYLPILQK